MKNLHEKFDADKQAFKAQKELVAKIEYMRKEQKHIIKEKREKERQEKMEIKLQEEAELERQKQEQLEKELAEDPYNEDVSICTLLSDYCKKLLPKQQDNGVEILEEKKDVTSILQSKAWSKDNVTVVAGKQKIDEEPVRKGKGKKTNKKADLSKRSEEKLNHTVEVLNFFEHVSINPPHYMRNLEDTIQLL